MSDWFFGLQSPVTLLAVLFVLLMAGAVGFPIPEDVPLILGGIVSHRGNISPWATFAVCYSGVIVGDLIVYSIGRKLGPSLFEKEWFKARVTSRKVKRFRLRLEKRSLLMIFIARHLFYLRSVTFLTCGAVKMRTLRFVSADALAALISVPLMIWIGYVCSEHYETLLSVLHKAKVWSLIIGIPIIIILAYRIFCKERKTPKAKATED
ncbi:MAG: DedA family protein [Candidatus Dadabacteria bacterium]|nr:MAG: DedA family protein [Candidatus Dadabacteria bacterium]